MVELKITSFLSVDAETIIRIRENFIKKIEGLKKHKDTTEEQKDVLDWVIEELNNRFYIEEYEG